MLNEKPVVLLDVDDVVANCSGAMSDIYYAKTGLTVDMTKFKSWNFFDNIAHPDYPGIVDHIDSQMRMSGFCMELQPFDGAVDGVMRLKEIAEVFFVTSPYEGPNWHHERENWLRHHFKVGRDRVLQASAKFLVRGELFIDDKPESCIAWLKHMQTGNAFIWDRPYNRNIEGSWLPRFHDWDQVYAYVKFLPMIDLSREEEE